jgi:hypothetical protein
MSLLPAQPAPARLAAAAAPARAAGLPLLHNLTPIYLASALIALLTAAASAAGLLYRASFYPAELLRRDLAALDVVNLCVGLPVLLACMALARRGSLIGLLCWPGALFFILYSYLIYVFSMPAGLPFLLHLALVTLSLYGLAGLLACIDGPAVRGALSGFIPVRIAAVAIGGQGVLNFLWVAADTVLPLALGLPMDGTVLGNHITDILVTPAWMIAGVLLWRRQPTGFVAGPGLLLQGSLFISSAILLLPLRSLGGGAPVNPAQLGLIAAGGLVCFIPFALLARGVLRASRST